MSLCCGWLRGVEKLFAVWSVLLFVIFCMFWGFFFVFMFCFVLFSGRGVAMELTVEFSVSVV